MKMNSNSHEIVWDMLDEAILECWRNFVHAEQDWENENEK